MNRYERYKDSGIPWLGEVPAHWNIVGISKLFMLKAGGDLQPDFFSREKDDEHCYPIYTNANDEHAVYGYTSKKRFNADSITVSGRGDIGFAVYRDHDFDAIIRLLVLSPLKKLDCKYYTYSINALLDFKFESSAVAQLSTVQLAQYKLLLPDYDEQTAIAHYLDTKLGEIDALIEKQQTLLEKLAEQRTAVITQAVTKGLNPAAPMKNSGVEWLGDVPAHWGVKRLKNSIAFSKNGIWGDEEKFDENDMYCLRVADFNRTNFTISETNLTIRNINPKDYESRKLKKGDLLLEKSGGGDKQPVGFVVLNTVAKKSVCSNFIAQLKLAENMNAQFWVYFHQFLYALRINVRSIKQSTGIQNLDETLYFNELACYPPLEEQTAIAEYLDQETAKIDRLCETVNQTIGRLKEYRTALITQAVTGKIKVTDE